jgi:methionine synthase I (cobalamin-dependent)
VAGTDADHDSAPDREMQKSLQAIDEGLVEGGGEASLLETSHAADVARRALAGAARGMVEIPGASFTTGEAGVDGCGATPRG